MHRTTPSLWNYLWILSLGTITAALSAGADTRLVRQTAPATDTEARSFRLFAGVDAGYAALNVPGGNKELDKNGYVVGLKGVGSWRLADRWLLDLGVGAYFTRLEGTTSARNERLWFVAGLADLNPRLRLGERFQAGPFLDLGFAFDQNYDQTLDSNRKIAFYPGVQFFYEINQGQIPLRIGARLGTDFPESSRRLWFAQASFQFGLPLGRSMRETSPLPVAYLPAAGAPTEPVVVVEEELLLLPAQALAQRGFNLGADATHFKTASAELNPRAKAYLEQMGHYLMEHREQWEAIEVSGHTDVRGSYAYNLQLSRARAASVANALEQAGVPRVDLHSQGYSYSNPIDPANTPVAWAKNRRVEIKFSGPGALQ